MRIEQRVCESVVDDIKHGRVDNLLTAIKLDRLLSKPIAGASSMPSALTMRAKIQNIRAAHQQRLMDVDAQLDVELSAVDAEAKRTADELEFALRRDVEAHKAEIRELRDELNQMTNGGPSTPLSDSENSQGSSKGASTA